eukprot:UN13104
MEDLMMTIVMQILHRYVNTMNEIEVTYNERIHDLITQKQLIHNQITNLFCQQLQLAINTIQTLKRNSIHYYDNNYQQQSDYLSKNEQNNNNKNSDKFGINLLLQAHKLIKAKNNMDSPEQLVPPKNISNKTRNNTLLKRHVQLAHTYDARDDDNDSGNGSADESVNGSADDSVNASADDLVNGSADDSADDTASDTDDYTDNDIDTDHNDDEKMHKIEI